MNPFQSLREYEQFIYSLAEDFPVIRRSTLTIVRLGRGMAELRGEVDFLVNIRLRVYELLTWDDGVLLIDAYSYDVFQSDSQLYWYDSQPHPHIPSLASTDPHHKHIPPDIKHNRIPAPGLSFTAPNLPYLIHEIEARKADD
ncbi:MAG: hypothetical protein KF753_16610 [Caldilineaceae bacterium]|nr:hypothetical protein [Caldilineaceae bacterium]